MKKLFLSLIVLLFVFSCNNGAKKDENQVKAEKNKETLVTTIPPLKWLVEKIAGDEFEVISIIKSNMNHELFEPKPEDLKVLENSKILFTYNALNFEEKIGDSLEKHKVAFLLENIDESMLLENHHDHDHDHDHNHKHSKDEHKKDDHTSEHHHDEAFDPHVWFSLDLMPKVAENIKNKLSATYPDKSEMFEKNYLEFLKELDEFKFQIKDKMSKKVKKHFIIYHPTLEYFLKGYDIEEIEVEQDGKEPTAKQIKEIIEEAKEHQITTILVQPQFPKESTEIISKEVKGSKVIEFNADEENVFENLNKFVDSLE